MPAGRRGDSNLRGLANFRANDFPFIGFVFFDGGEESLALVEYQQ